MKLIDGGKGKEPKPTPEERAQKQKLRLQAEFIKNLEELIPLDEVLDNYQFEMSRETMEEGLIKVVLKFKKKGGAP